MVSSAAELKLVKCCLNWFSGSYSTSGSACDFARQ